MRAVVQRVARAAVWLPHREAGGDGPRRREIGRGVAVLLGVGREDTEEDALYMADKIAHLRIFEDDEGKMNRSLLDVGGAALVVSQFTLYGDVRRGRRPSFIEAAAPDRALELYGQVVGELESLGVPVETGWFQEHMRVEIHNDGPVTILVDSRRLF